MSVVFTGSRRSSTLVVLRLTCALVVLALCVQRGAHAQDDTTFVASVDRASITVDDVLTLRLTLSGAFRHAAQPQFPAMQDFHVLGSSQSSQFSMTSGRSATGSPRLRPGH